VTIAKCGGGKRYVIELIQFVLKPWTACIVTVEWQLSVGSLALENDMEFPIQIITIVLRSFNGRYKQSWPIFDEERIRAIICKNSMYGGRFVVLNS
jgi:hypothetical protein